MREMDFTEGNVSNRWMGVKSIWREMHFETKRYIRRYLESSLRLDLDSRLGCGRYERAGSRKGYRNGSYTRDFLTSYGWIEGLEIPRARDIAYQPRLLERYKRRQKCVDKVLLEAFLLGHSTRQTRRMFSSLFGGEISAQTISNIARELDSSVHEFRSRRFDSSRYTCVYLDGLWITLSKPVKTKKVVLVALGLRPDGTKELLNFQLASSESESWWWGFVSDLKDRGLRGNQIDVIVTDGCAGLIKAVTALYPRVRRQLCTFHKANDLGAHLRDRRHRNQIIRHALSVFEADTNTEVRKNLRAFSERWKPLEPKAVRNFIAGFDYCLTFLDFPDTIRSAIKTNNPIERYLQEIRRRIIPMRSFNNVKSAERIIYGIIAVTLKQYCDMPIHQSTQYA